MAGRRINDAMGRYFARELIKKMIHKKITIMNADVLILGITFKENVPDIRNSKVIDIIKELKDFGINIQVWDPVANPEEVKKEYGIDLVENVQNKTFDSIVLAVKHKQFLSMSRDDFGKLLSSDGLFYDIKEVL
jgi:UDP-N-acetyl-D-galactosamine dehydrogenase